MAIMGKWSWLHLTLSPIFLPPTGLHPPQFQANYFGSRLAVDTFLCISDF
jgi:hypothetical protein